MPDLLNETRKLEEDLHHLRMKFKDQELDIKEFEHNIKIAIKRFIERIDTRLMEMMIK